MDAATLIEPNRVRVELDERSYDILIGARFAGAGRRVFAPEFVKQKRVFILSDETVWALHGETLGQAAGLSARILRRSKNSTCRRKHQELDLLGRNASTGCWSTAPAATMYSSPLAAV